MPGVITCSVHRSFYLVVAESSDDILAKYRRQPGAGGSGRSSVRSKAMGDSTDAAADDDSSVKGKARLRSGSGSIDEGPEYDPRNLETCRAFVDAKKKLRLVLSTAELMVNMAFLIQLEPPFP